MIIDTSPLFAIADTKQATSARCRNVFDTLPKPLITTWAALAETMHLTGREGGWTMQHSVWRMLDAGLVTIHHTDREELKRIRELMEKYNDRPMNLADATLAAAAETLSIRKIFTRDSDFYVYRFKDTEWFEVVS